MHRHLCLDPIDSSEQILPSPPSSLCRPPPATPSFCLRGQPVPVSKMPPSPGPANWTPPPSWLSLVVGPSTCTPREGSVSKGGRRSKSLYGLVTVHLQLVPHCTHTPYSQPHKHTLGLQPATLNTFCLSNLSRGQALTHVPPSSWNTVPLPFAPYPLHVTETLPKHPCLCRPGSAALPLCARISARMTLYSNGTRAGLYPILRDRQILRAEGLSEHLAFIA